MADVAGVLAANSVVPALGPETAAQLVASGVAVGGMAAKLEAARSALGAGVGRVRIGDLAALLDPTLGTSVVAQDGSRSIGGPPAPAGTTAAAPGFTGSQFTQSAV
jgi:hypothetical protein